MAPLRSRANRNQGDDETSILKGLPIRQWRLTKETIGPPVEVKPEAQQNNARGDPLPRDFSMLPEISQQLLRKAREGQIYLKPTPVANGKDDKGKGVGKDVDGGFVSKKWTLVARDQEAEEPTYLAKRRKGLPPTFGVGIANINPQTSYRTTKVKKYDAEGKLHVYEVLAPEGQQVEGEIVAEDDTAKAVPVEPVAAAPGTVVEGVGVVNEHGVVVSNDLLLPTPPRRKPPPPRRKPKKGPGRGKKKVIFEGGEAPVGDGTAAAGLLNVPGIAAAERATDSAAPSSQADTPMPDAGDDEEGSGSEGEEGDDGEDGREEGELSPSPEPEDATGEKQSVPPLEAEPVAAPPTEVKEEQNDDAMAIDSAPQETTDPAIPVSIDAVPAPEAAALPSLAQAPTSPSPPAQPEPSSSTAVTTDPHPAAIPSSPEIPLAASATSEAPEIPGLPAPVSTDPPAAVVEEQISTDSVPESDVQTLEPAPDAAVKSIEDAAATPDAAMTENNEAGEEVDLVAQPTTASEERKEPKAEETKEPKAEEAA